MAAAQPRLGVLGGSFDPPHIAHLAIASEACHALGLTRVLFVPAAAPPHKGDARAHRGRRHGSRWRRWRSTTTSASPSRASRSNAASCTPPTRCGCSAPGTPTTTSCSSWGRTRFCSSRAWHEPEELLSLCSLAVAPRPGDAPEAIAAAAARWGDHQVTLLDVPLLDVASSDIRERAAQQRPIRYLVPHRVEQYILETGLYR